MTNNTFMENRVLLKIGGMCNSNCRFCHTGGPKNDIHLPPDEVFRRVLSAKKSGYTMAVLSGGEPTFHPDFPKIMSFFRKIQYPFGIISNGRTLSDRSFVQAMVRSGLSYVNLSFHSHDAKTHNDLVGVPSFSEVDQALLNLSESNIDLAVTTVVCQSNLDGLQDTVRFMAERLKHFDGHRARHRLSLIEPKGNAFENDLLLPNLEDASASICHAIANGNRRFNDSVERGYDGFPTCLAPGPQSMLFDLQSFGIEAMQEVHEGGLSATDSGTRAYADQCRECSLRPHCPGLFVGYFPRSAEELIPRIGPKTNTVVYCRQSQLQARPGPTCPIATGEQSLDLTSRQAKKALLARLSSDEEGTAQLFKTVTTEYGTQEIVRFRDLFGYAKGLARKDPTHLSLEGQCIECPKWGECPGLFVPFPGDPELYFKNLVRESLKNLEGKILDVGCGEIPYASELAEVQGLRSYLGVDPNTKPNLDAPYLKHQKCRFEDLKTKSSFDWILFIRSINHLAHPELSLERSIEMLSPEGKLVIADFAPSLILEWGSSEGTGSEKPSYFRDLSSLDLAQTLQRLGMSEVIHHPPSYERGNGWILTYKK